MSQRTVAIREEDYEELRKIAQEEGRTMTEILHRLLTGEKRK